jgi:putative membrane protein
MVTLGCARPQPAAGVRLMEEAAFMLLKARTTFRFSPLVLAPLAMAGMLYANEPAATIPVSRSDQQFIREAGAGGMAEVEMAKLAIQKAASPQVKEFAERMIADHGKANRKLEKIAASHGVTVSAELDAEHEAKLNELAKQSGEAFDAHYMKAQVAGHEKMQALLEDEAKTTKDQALRTFVQETLPTVEAHHRMAQDIQGKIGAPRASAAD